MQVKWDSSILVRMQMLMDYKKGKQICEIVSDLRGIVKPIQLYGFEKKATFPLKYRP